jgi:hypothetical protein
VHNAWFVCNVRFDEKHTELPGQLVGKQAVEEGVVLLSPVLVVLNKLGRGANISVRSSDGFWEARGGRMKSCSTHWMSVNWCAANMRQRSSM